ncbi:MAG: amino acid-binding protein, partial [Arthrobacter sp.]
TSELSCEVCGLLPEPTKARLTLANVAVMLPIELLLHAFVVQTHLLYLAKVLVLTLTATILVIWVAEPSAVRVLRCWLHAPALRHRRRLGAAPWRARSVLKDRPGSLQKLTQSLARLDTNIGTVMRIPTAWHGPITFVRPGEPFTPAESARAHRLAEIRAHRQSPAGDGRGSLPGSVLDCVS